MLYSFTIETRTMPIIDMAARIPRAMFSGQKDILVRLEERKYNKGKVKSLHFFTLIMSPALLQVN